MAPRFNTQMNESLRKPLADINRDLTRPSGSILSAIPESGKPSDKVNVSRAVFVHNGQGHNVEEDPAEEDIGMITFVFRSNLSGRENAGQ